MLVPPQHPLTTLYPKMLVFRHHLQAGIEGITALGRETAPSRRGFLLPRQRVEVHCLVFLLELNGIATMCAIRKGKIGICPLNFHFLLHLPLFLMRPFSLSLETPMVKTKETEIFFFYHFLLTESNPGCVLWCSKESFANYVVLTSVYRSFGVGGVMPTIWALDRHNLGL